MKKRYCKHNKKNVHIILLKLLQFCIFCKEYKTNKQNYCLGFVRKSIAVDNNCLLQFTLTFKLNK